MIVMAKGKHQRRNPKGKTDGELRRTREAPFLDVTQIVHGVRIVGRQPDGRDAAGGYTAVVSGSPLHLNVPTIFSLVGNQANMPHCFLASHD